VVAVRSSAAAPVNVSLPAVVVKSAVEAPVRVSAFALEDARSREREGRD
jgi:hypothetical protein